jgi:endonuclease/exonuclease/phosphatase family metal-dependent hydrolase|tara:strand:+ start:2412 stop:3293 length:882 start_codon:yes stop_codon:yes gene_type:complete
MIERIVAIVLLMSGAVASAMGQSVTVKPMLQSSTLTVLTYNTFLRTPTWFFRDNQDWRIQHMPGRLSGYDVVVLQEAFSSDHRRRVLDALKSDYPYQSKILGFDQLFSLNGGVVVLSRWPIDREAEHIFSVCNWPDCWVKKGVVYVRLNVNQQVVHLFGLHLQAEDEFAPTRLKQLGEVEVFVQAQRIPPHEPVLIAGDFNVDYFANDTDGEFDALAGALNTVFPEPQPAASYDSATNSMLQEDAKQRLDYVLYCRDHRQPNAVTSEVVHVREHDLDLSDHHAVVSEMRFTDR